MICGPNCEIYDLVNSWPGLAHDARIWNQSDICHRINTLDSEYHLLRDSAYPLRNNLLVPYKNPINEAKFIFILTYKFFKMNSHII